MTPHTTFEKDRLDQEVNNFLFEIEEEKRRKEEEKRQKEIKAQELSEFKKQAVIEYYLKIKHDIYSKNSISCENGVLYYEVKEDCIRLYFVEKYLSFKLDESLEGGFYLDLTFNNKTCFETFQVLLTNEIFVNEVLSTIKNLGNTNLIVETSLGIYKDEHSSSYIDSTELSPWLLGSFKKSSVKSFSDFFSFINYKECEVRIKKLANIKKARHSYNNYRWLPERPPRSYFLETVDCYEEEYDNIFGKFPEEKPKNLICSRGCIPDLNELEKNLAKMKNFNDNLDKFIQEQEILAIYILKITATIIIAIIAAICFAFALGIIK